MSYCRMGDESDVYVFKSTFGYIECCYCPLESKSVQLETRKQALAHLIKHRRHGHQVPQEVFDRLQAELKEEGNEVA